MPARKNMYNKYMNLATGNCKLIGIFSAILLSGLLFCSIWKFIDIQIGNISGFGILFSGLFFSIQLFLMFKFLLRGIEYVDTRMRVGKFVVPLILFIGMISLVVILLCLIKSVPEKDSFDDLDAAWYIFRYGAVYSDNIHYWPLSRYFNNYFYIFFLVKCYKLLSVIGIENVLTGMRIINALAIVIGVFFVWYFMKDAYGINRANKCLFFLVCNPLIYYLIFWIYSLTLSIPLMTIAVWTINRLHKARKKEIVLLYAFILAVDVSVGYLMRPTAIFPFVAFSLIKAMYVLSLNRIKKYIVVATILLICWLPIEKLYADSVEKCFGEITEANYPIWYWTSMGAHGNGDISTKAADQKIAEEIIDYDERSLALKNTTICYYKNNGIVGTIMLWGKKTSNTWAVGFGEIYERIWNGESNTIVSDYMYGEHKNIIAFFAQSYRVLSIFTMLLFCLDRIKRGSFTEIETVLLLTFLGGVCFFCFWEAKYIYSFPFYVIFSTISVLGMESDLLSYRLLRNKNTRCWQILFVLCVVLMVGGLSVLARQMVEMDYERIRCANVKRKRVEVCCEKKIEQEFFCKKKFNKIEIFVNLPKKNQGQNLEQFSDYYIELYDDNGTLLETTIMCVLNIRKGKYVWNLIDFVPNGHYFLQIKKITPEKENISFLARNAYKYDCYSGRLLIDEVEKVYDLNINVVYSVKEYYMNEKEYLFVLVVYILVSGVNLACFEKKYVNVIKKVGC